MDKHQALLSLTTYSQVERQANLRIQTMEAQGVTHLSYISILITTVESAKYTNIHKSKTSTT